MAFAIRNLSVLNYAQGFSYWHYRGGTDTLDQIAACGFFDAATDMVVIGDMILVSCSQGGAMLYVDATKPAVVTRQMCATSGGE